jgi:CTP synthase
MFCHVSSEQVFGVHDLSSVYRVPLLLKSQGVLEYLIKRLKLDKLQLTQTMIDKGQMLENQWKHITTR